MDAIVLDGARNFVCVFAHFCVPCKLCTWHSVHKLSCIIIKNLFSKYIVLCAANCDSQPASDTVERRTIEIATSHLQPANTHPFISYRARDNFKLWLVDSTRSLHVSSAKLNFQCSSSSSRNPETFLPLISFASTRSWFSQQILVPNSRIPIFSASNEWSWGKVYALHPCRQGNNAQKQSVNENCTQKKFEKSTEKKWRKKCIS